MTNEQIRRKILCGGQFPKSVLEGFEKTIGEVWFYKGTTGYFVYPIGTKGFSEDALNQQPAKTLSEMIMFLYGVYASGIIKRKPKLVIKTENEDTMIIEEKK